MDNKKFLDMTGLSKFKEWLDKTYVLKDDMDKYVSKDEFEKLKAEVDVLKSKVN